MKPQEISDYKLSWRPGYRVGIHTDHDVSAKLWCKRHVQKKAYHIIKWTDVYEHTYEFESEKVANAFAKDYHGILK